MENTKKYQTPSVEIVRMQTVDCLGTSRYDNDVLDRDWDFSKF